MAATELGPRGIRLNAIAPGYTRSEGTEAEGLLGEESIKQYISVTPLGRLGEPEDIAAVAVFLASDESSWSLAKPFESAAAPAEIADEQLDTLR